MNGASSTQPTQGYNPESSYQGSTEGEQAIADRFTRLAKDLQGQEALDTQRVGLATPEVTQGDNVAHTADQDRRDGETSQVENNTAPETAPQKEAPGAPNVFDTFHAKDSLPDTQGSGTSESHGSETTSPLSGNAGNTVEDTITRFDGSGTSADHHLLRAEAGYTSTYDTEAGRIPQLQRSPIDTGNRESNGARTVLYNTDNETSPLTQSNPNGGGNNFTPRPPDGVAIDPKYADNNVVPPELKDRQYTDPETPADSVEGAQDNSEQAHNSEIAKQTAEMVEIIEKMRDKMKSELKAIASQFESADASLRALYNDLGRQNDVDESLIDMVGRTHREAQDGTKAMHDQIAQFDQQTLNNLSEGSVNELISDMMHNSTDGKGIDGKKIEKTVFDTIAEFNKLFSEKPSQLDKTIETIRDLGYRQENPDISRRINDTAQDMDNHKSAVESAKNALRSDLELSGWGLSDKIRALNSTMIASKQAPEANEPEPKSAAGNDEPPERREDNSDDRTPEDSL